MPCVVAAVTGGPAAVIATTAAAAAAVTVLLLFDPEYRLHGVDDLRVEPHSTEIDKPLGPNDVRIRVGYG